MYIFFESIKLQIKQSYARSLIKFIIFVQPMLYSFMIFKIYENSGINDGVIYSIIGSGLFSLWSSITFTSASEIERERGMGTLEVLAIAPSDIKVIFLGKVIGNTVLGLVSMIVSFITVALLFHVILIPAQPMLFIVALLLGILSYISIGLLVSLIFTLSKNARLIMNVIEYPFLILCGTAFPITVLPEKLQYISYFLSPYWLIESIKLTISGQNKIALFHSIIILSILSLMYFLISIPLYNLVDKKTRIDATLGGQ